VSGKAGEVQDIKVKLREKYAMLNPAELKRKITKLQNRLLKLNVLKQGVRKDLVKKSFFGKIFFIFFLKVSLTLVLVALIDKKKMKKHAGFPLFRR